MFFLSLFHLSRVPPNRVGSYIFVFIASYYSFKILWFLVASVGMKVIHSHLNITQVELLKSYFKMFSWVRFSDPMEIGWLLEVIVDFPYYKIYCCYCSVTKLSLTLPPHGLQQARLPCSSLSPRVCSNSCPLNWRCHPTISSYIVPFSCLQSFPTLVFSQELTLHIR